LPTAVAEEAVLVVFQQISLVFNDVKLTINQKSLLPALVTQHLKHNELPTACHTGFSILTLV
jgi:hypothetical protein